jgi:AcrR family transcriptional regulator
MSASRTHAQTKAPAHSPGAARRSRRRGTALEAALLDAAWEELAASGYARLTMEAVAARAGTSKAVLYRRWPSRPELVIAAAQHKTPRLTPENIPDTGTLRGDLINVLHQASEHYEGLFREALHGVMSDFYRDPKLAAFLHVDVFGNAARLIPVILERASERGEIDPGRITPRQARLPLDLFRHELLTSRGPVPATTAAEIVDDVFLPLVANGERTGSSHQG